MFCYRMLAPFFAVIVLAAAMPAAAQTPEEKAERAEKLEARAGEAVETMQALMESHKALTTDIDRMTSEIESAAEAEKPELIKALDEKKAELAEVEDQLSNLATGVVESEFLRRAPAKFDLQSEVEALIEPFVVMLRNATEEARQIEATRRALNSAEERKLTIAQAIETLEAVRKAADGTILTEDLEARATTWAERQKATEATISALRQQLDDLLNSRVTAGAQVESAARGFFRERGLSLLMGVGAFLGVFMVLRLIARFFTMIGRHRGIRRNFYTRLGNLVFSVFTIAASFSAMIIIFNLRNDWLLLGLSTLILLALVWIGIRMVPSLIEQVTLLLNLGAVQENERVVFHNVPFRVQRLDLYTDLVNPDLDGGEFTVPVRELIGLHSRPAAEDEAWFPSKKGDWVRLADGRAGQVVAQTPEMVVIQLLGGARVTYQTADYLGQTPENLSEGFRVEVEFGIGYGHQAQAADAVIETMATGIREHMTVFVGAEYVIGADVEFLRAGASSLDYEVEVDVTGAVAHRFEDIERVLARALVLIANRENWEIPFQQIVLHRA